MLAHEVGHHVQNLLGILPKAHQAQQAAGNRAAANRIQVQVELQADCFAGIWANQSNQRWKSIEPGDVEAALQTAAAIGDDRLQQRRAARCAGSFTHGSSAQRQRWFTIGLKARQGVGLQYVRAKQSIVDGAHSQGICDMPGIDESRQFVPLKIAVLTVSDTRELADDKSGNTLIERIRAAGHVVAERSIVKDEVDAIRSKVKAWIDDKFIDVVISTGGTGFTGRDVTPEAVEPLFEKRMDGFSTIFHDGELSEDRHLGDPDPRHRRRRQCDLHFLPAGLARRLQGCLGRHPRPPARLPLPAVQFRRDPAEAG